MSKALKAVFRKSSAKVTEVDIEKNVQAAVVKEEEPSCSSPLSEAFEVLQARYGWLQKSCDRMAKGYAELFKEKEDVSSQCEGLRRENSELRDDYEALKKSHADVVKENEKLKCAVDVLIEAKSRKNEVEELRIRLKQLETEMSNLKGGRSDKIADHSEMLFVHSEGDDFNVVDRDDDENTSVTGSVDSFERLAEDEHEAEASEDDSAL